MANDTTVKLNITSGTSLDKEIDKAQSLRDTLLEASKALKAAAGSAPARPRATAASAASERGTTGLARSIGTDAGTGSGARDFAKQASGLGGVVRLYATFAANIFAVSAAFTALSNAADTSNLIKGLDQLGAAAGRNLGGLSKEFARATDNAISLKEASIAVAKASSSGLGREDILRVATVAKTASQALGVDMTDAVSRLTRGITKLEPELLDELGIFTRVDKASQDYAKSIGKSTLSLTDFEKRQAFANAVLSEGEKKFGALKVDSNPYSKLAASFTDLTNKGLELVNKVLGPIAELLSRSPVALGLTIVGIGTSLLKQAIPQLSEWKDALDNTAASARQASQASAKAVKDFNNTRASEAYPKYFKAKIEADAALAELSNKMSSSTKGATLIKTTIKDKSSADITAEQLKQIQSINDAEEKRVAKAIASGKLTNEKTKMQYAAQIAATKEFVEKQNAVIRAASEEKAFMDETTNRTRLGRLKNYFTEEATLQRIADKDRKAENRANMLSQAVQAVPTKGTIGAWRELSFAVNNAMSGKDPSGKPFEDPKDKMSKIDGALTKVRGGASLAARAVGNFASSLGSVGMVVGIAVVAFQVLDSIFAKNTKQAAVFNDSLESIQSSIKNVTATLANITAKDPLEKLSVESTQARANALLDLSGSISKAIASFDKVEAAAGKWDNFWDGVFDIAGMGNLDKLRDGISQGVQASIDSIQEGPAKEAAIAKIRSILNISTEKIDSAAVSKALGKLSDTAATAKIKELSPVLKLITNDINNVAAAGTQYNDSLKQTSKLLEENTASLKAQDFLSKIGDALVSQSKDLSEAIKDPIQAIQVLIRTAEDTKSLSLLPVDTALQLQNSKKELQALLITYDSVGEKIRELKDEQSSIQGRVSSEGRGTSKEDRNRLAALKLAQSEYEKVATGLGSKVASASADAAKLITEKFVAGIEYLYKGLNAARRKAQLEFDKTRLSAIESVGGTDVKEDIRIRKEEIQIALDDIEARYKNTEAIERLTVVSNLIAAVTSRNAAKPEDQPKFDETILVLTRATELITKFSGAQLLALGKQALPGSLDQKALAATGSLVSANLGKQAAQAAGRSQLRALGQITAPLVEGVAEQKNLERRNALEAASNALSAEYLRTSSEISGVFSEIVAQQQLKLALEGLSRKNNTEEAEARRKIAVLEDTRAPGEQIALAEAELKIITAKYDQEVALAGLRSRADTAKNLQIQETALAERELALQDQIRNTKSAILEQDQRRLDLLSQLGDRSTEVSSLELSFAKEQLDLETKLAGIRQARASEVGAKSAVISSLPKDNTAAGASQLAILNAEKDAIKAKYDAEEASLLRIYEARDKQNKQLIEYKSALESITNVTETLSNIFGKMGASFGEVARSILDTTTRSKIYAEEAVTNTKAQAEAQNTLNAARMGGDPKDIADSEKALNKVKSDGIKIQTKSIDNQLDGYSSVLGAIKKTAGEQSRTAQVIGKVEKAIHIAKMAMWAKEQIAVLTNSATTISAALAAAGANSVKAISAAFAAPFPIGFVAGAAMIAIMSSLLGGKAKKPPVNFSAESQQAVQGTGQQYNSSGKVVSRAGGALGDDTAVAKSIDDSISLIEEHSFKNLEYSNKMLDNLKSIKNNTAGLTAALLQAGFNIKGGAGIAEGTTKGKTFDPLGLTKIPDLLGAGDTGIGRAINKISNSIFGGKTTTEIQDTGIAIQGTLTALIEGAQGLAQQYTNIRTVVKGGWFKSDKMNFETIRDDLSAPVNRAISDTFKNIKDTVLSASDALGANSDIVKSIVDNFDIAIKVSAQGLKPDELAAAITAELSVAFNSVAEKAFPELQQFRKGGEEMGATVVRLARDMQLTTLALESAGLSLQALGSLVDRVGITENLIELTGGLEQFLSKTEFFKDNFLTKAEQLVPVQKRVTDELGRLGFAAVDTRAEFKGLVNSLDLSSEYGQETYASLMNVASAFAEVYPEAQKSLSVQELINQQRNQAIEILKLEGRATEALALSRAEELAQLDPALVEGKKYIYQLQDRLSLIRAEAELLATSGRSSQALLLTREIELRNLTDSEKALKKAVFLSQDYNKTQGLSIQLLEAQGDTLQATNIKRQLELDNLSATDSAIQARIYQLQDEKKLLEAKLSQEEKIYTLTNRAQKALVITRNREMSVLDDLLKPSQQYIYALEDEANLKDRLKASYDKTSSAINGTIDGLQGSIKALKDYKTSLITSGDSLLSPAQKYAELKQQAADVAAIASGIATTDADKKAKEEAIAKLPEVSSAFLEASRTIYASSDQYTQDFANVMSILDTTSSALSSQLSDSQLQLQALEQNTTILELINENTLSTTELLSQYLALQTEFVTQQATTATAQATAAASGSAAAGGSFSLGAIELMAQTLLPENLKLIFEAAATQIVEPTLNIQNNIAAFTQKTAENTELTLIQLKAMVTELQQLRAEQQQQVADAAAMNYEANTVAATTVVAAIEEAVSNDDWWIRNAVNRD